MLYLQIRGGMIHLMTGARLRRLHRLCDVRTSTHCVTTAKRLFVRRMGLFQSRQTNESLQRTHSNVSEADSPYLIVGLGNPGKQYDNTRHNIGFEAVDALAASNGISWNKKLEHKALTANGSIQGRRVILCKPMAFMNVSGESVSPISRYYKIPLSKVLVIYDDIDSEPGIVRLKQKGGHGGHNGMRSIIQRFGSQMDFPRVKIGVGRPPGQMDVAAYVLGSFTKAEHTLKEAALQDAVRTAESVCGLGLEMACSGKRL